MKHKEKHAASHSKKGRRKAFLLLIILGVVVMCVYFLSLQQFEDEELVEETNPGLVEPESGQ